MRIINYPDIIREAWDSYDSSRSILSIEDISAKVSTNHVFRVVLDTDEMVIAKLSYFGKYEHFKEDHRIIHALANNLLYPFENLLSKSLVKNNQVFTYRYQKEFIDTWVVFYSPIRSFNRLPRRLNEAQIGQLGGEIARFHKSCFRVSKVLPKSAKTLKVDINHLQEILHTDAGQFDYRMHIDFLKEQCDLFLNNYSRLNAGSFDIMPVFVDWNIGNFSVNEKLQLYSRWDYDWFRMSTRVMDFYFFSRVSSDAGDRTIFQYLANTMMEDRFIIFLKAYHDVYPLTENEIRFMKEAYRFFILNYVIKYGKYFFHRTYASKLQSEALSLYLPELDKVFDADKILKALKF